LISILAVKKSHNIGLWLALRTGLARAQQDVWGVSDTLNMPKISRQKANAGPAVCDPSISSFHNYGPSHLETVSRLLNSFIFGQLSYIGGWATECAAGSR